MTSVQTDRVEVLFAKHAINVPQPIVQSLCKEFGLPNNEVDNFVTLLIEKALNERISEANSKIFTDSETKELEEDLKGLGYI